VLPLLSNIEELVLWIGSGGTFFVEDTFSISSSRLSRGTKALSTASQMTSIGSSMRFYFEN
jgi:hypothetical protein